MARTTVVTGYSEPMTPTVLVIPSRQGEREEGVGAGVEQADDGRRPQIRRAVGQPLAPDRHHQGQGGERRAAVDGHRPRHAAGVAGGVGAHEEGAEGQRREGGERRARSDPPPAALRRDRARRPPARRRPRPARGRRPPPGAGRSPPATPAATGTTAASEASGATTLIGPMASARYSAAKPAISARPAPRRDQHRIGRRRGLARQREQDRAGAPGRRPGREPAR